jgi:cyclomaltodextrinase / maltogenic alpha-amylase / neopullulanase
MNNQMLNKKTWRIIAILFLCFSKVYSQNGEGSSMLEKEFVPQWAKKLYGTRYFLTDFSNGDRTNDPDVTSLKVHGLTIIHHHGKCIPGHPTGMNCSLMNKENRRDIWFNIQRRRYGGDLQGIIR